MASSLARRGRRGLVLPSSPALQASPHIHPPPSLSPSSSVPHHYSHQAHQLHLPLHSNQTLLPPTNPLPEHAAIIVAGSEPTYPEDNQFATSLAPVAIYHPQKYSNAPASIETPPIPLLPPPHPPSPSTPKSYFPPFQSYVASQQSQHQQHLVRPKTPTSPLSPIGSINRSPRSPISPAPGQATSIKMIQTERPPSPLTLSTAMTGPDSVMSPGFAPTIRQKSNLKLSSLPGSSMRGYTPTSLQQQQIAMQLQQQQFIYQATRAAASLGGPASPRLAPLGSPGPVTPMMLEDPQGGYLFAGNQPALQLQQHHIDKLLAASAVADIEEENRASTL